MQYSYKRKKSDIIIFVIMLFIVAFLSCCTTYALLRDSESSEATLTLADIILEADTYASAFLELDDIYTGQQLLADDVYFSVGSGSGDMYVRSTLAVSTTEENMHIREFLLAEDIIQTPAEGFSWVRYGEYYYLHEGNSLAILNNYDSGTYFEFLSMDTFVIPNTVYTSLGHYNPDDETTLSIMIAIEAIQILLPSVDNNTATIQDIHPYFSIKSENEPSSGTILTITIFINNVANYYYASYGEAVNYSQPLDTYLNTFLNGTGATVSIDRLSSVANSMILYQLELL